jgi:hypothetical protein
MATHDDSGPEYPVLWLSDEPLPDAAQRWERLYVIRTQTGLYPLLLDTLDSPFAGGPGRPWRDGSDLFYQPVAAIDAMDAEAVLREWWRGGNGDEGDSGSDSPLGRPWPGLAASGEQHIDPDRFAGMVAADLDGGKSRLLGLAPTSRGADALTAVGWSGPANHTNDIRKISTVVRSWEERFGARVVMVGFDTLCLSVAAPPGTREHARAVAIEHYAFCPDNVDQGTGDFDQYADLLIDADSWWFWWD